MQKAVRLALAVALLVVTVCGQMLAAEIRTGLGRNYFGIYDTKQKSLHCVSENDGRHWNVNVSNSIPSQADWAGTGTSAGPVVVWTSGNNVYFILMRYQTGATVAENSKESLKGTVAPGRLISASWDIQQYGAKGTIVSLDGNTEYTTKMDINMWGTSKQISRTIRNLPNRRMQLPGSKLSVDVPPGFSAVWNGADTSLVVTPDTKIPIGMLVVLAEPGIDLTEFANLFMRDIGPAMGSPDMKQAASENVTIGGTMPGLLRMAKGTRNGKEAAFAFVFFQTKENTVVMVYGTLSEYYDTYANIFYRLLGGVQVK